MYNAGMKQKPCRHFEYTRQTMEFMSVTRLAVEKLESSGIIPSIIDASDIFCSCQGKIITTGMGKAGHVAKKAASTFSSLALPSCYLHPAEASHGDSGIADADDNILVFSTSGKTREVIETIELFRKLSNGDAEHGPGKVVAITSHPESPVRDMSDLVIDIGVIQEAGHLSLAPTTSVVIMLMVSDMIASLCAYRKGLTIEQFGLRHHSGYLGMKCRGEKI